MINKADKDPIAAEELRRIFDGSVIVSAARGEGIEGLLQVLGDRLRTHDRVVALRIPHDRGDILAAAHREGEVVDAQQDEEATLLHVVLDEAGRAAFSQFEVTL